MNSRDYDGKEATTVVKWYSVAAVVVGGLVGFYVPWGIASINAMVVAIVIHVAGEKLLKHA